MDKKLRIAVVHDWLITKGGAEVVLENILECIKDNDIEIFTLFNFFKNKKSIINNYKIHSSFLQKIPFSKKIYRFLLPFYPLAIEQLDVRNFDLVISSSHSVAKNILVPSSIIHICYCHTPMRYAWDMYHDYFSDKKSFSILRIYQAITLHKIRIWDFIRTNRVDYFIANSIFVKNRIEKIYHKESIVIYPPVNTLNSNINELNILNTNENNKNDNYYITAGRMVHYKRFDLIIDSFNSKELTNKKLIVLGDGPELKSLKKSAINNKNIIFKGKTNREDFLNLIKKSKAFICAAIEDFGITTVEAQQLGVPIIALNLGGYKETVIENKTGYFFYPQNKNSLIKTIEKFEDKPLSNKTEIINNGNNFSSKRFKQEFLEFLNKISI